MLMSKAMEAELGRMKRWEHWAPAISGAEYVARLDHARALVDQAGASALVVCAGASLRYFTGVTWQQTERLVAAIIPLAGTPSIICPRFELGSLEAELKIEADILLWEEDEDPIDLIVQATSQARPLLVDPQMPFMQAQQLASAGRELREATGVINACRMCKSDTELALLQQAKSMTLAVHRAAAKVLEPGVRASEVARFIDAAHRALGASGSYFCAVQFGQATAYPHGLPHDQILEENQLVLIDTGCRIEGYHSDITRTYAFGTVGDLERSTWELEKAAQAAAFECAGPGVPCQSVDRAARDVITKAGLGPGYVLPGVPHRTGHGIGLAIHESPYLVEGDDTLLQPGMCFSNEPMIVYPDRFGIRLEDHFYVTPNGARWFTEPQHSLDDPFG